jgi:phage terminase small subunit
MTVKAKTMRPMNAKHKAFIAAYLRLKNATKAAREVGYAEVSAEERGREILARPDVAAAIAAHEAAILESAVKETGITLERTLREIAKAAFFDPRKFWNDDGSLKQPTELDDDTAAALAGFEVLEEFEGHGEDRRHVGYTKKVKLADRKGYLDMLMKHLGGFKADNEQTQQPLAEALRGFIGELHQAGSRLPFAAKKKGGK